MSGTDTPGLGANNAITLRLMSPLDLNALEKALRVLEQRHDNLRDPTIAQHNGTHHGGPLRIIDAKPDEDGQWLRIVQSQQSEPFDLRIEAGWRVAVVRLGDQPYSFSLVMHSSKFDAYSLGVFCRHLANSYSSALCCSPRTEPPVLSRLEPAVWQAQRAQKAELEGQLAYWTKELAGSRAAEILHDHSRPVAPSGRVQSIKFPLDGVQHQMLQTFCHARQVKPFVVLLAAFRATEYRLTHTTDAVIGMCVADESCREPKAPLGFFAKILPVRLVLDDRDHFVELVRHVQSVATAAFANQDIPFDHILSATATEQGARVQSPLVRLLFEFHELDDLGDALFNNKTCEVVDFCGFDTPTGAMADLRISFQHRIDGIHGAFHFAPDLWETSTIQKILTIFQEVLQHGLEEPEMEISCIPLGAGSEELHERGLLDIEHSTYPRESSIVDAFSSSAAVYKDNVAVKDSNIELTYSELDRQSDQLASWLRQQELEAETMVSVLAPRCCLTVVCFLAILKANLAYLPLDINAPPSRIETILASIPGHKKLVLLGPNVTAPEIPLTDGQPQFVRITTEMLQRQQPVEGVQASSLRPKATSLAYTIFTSGSTGKPKGVMIEHRGVVQLVQKNSFVSGLPSAARVAHLSNLAFDASIWEICASLLNGGTVVCIDYLMTLNPKALGERIEEERIQVAMLTPALLKLCLQYCPKAISTLEILYVGGDRFDPADARRACMLVRSAVYNAYGPTENTVASAAYKMNLEAELPNGVPIGSAISNSGVYIMDPQQHLVSVGVMGEVVLTGDGLARGYTDSALDLGRFLEIFISGTPVRAYRTGDRARWRPSDGQIEFFGRMDRQTKIRGHRVELSEIEQALLDHQETSDAAVVICGEPDSEAEVVGFVTLQNDGLMEREAVDQINGWAAHYEEIIYPSIKSIDSEKFGRDFVGWTSMFNGQPIPQAEMEEWLEDTIATILNESQDLGHILELGSGTGMMLFNLGQNFKSYLGIEPSQSAVRFVMGAVEKIPAIRGKVDIRVGTALDASRIEGVHPELVIVNSVVQHFPSMAYLEEVVESIIRIPGVKRIVFGDIRSHALYREFLAGLALYNVGDKAGKGDFRRYIAEKERLEEELLVDPGFFCNLQARFADAIEHVEILPKRMRATNELSSFRYTAVLHIKDIRKPNLLVHHIDESSWIDFSGLRLNRSILVRFLQMLLDVPVVAVRNIPYRKTIRERSIVDSLESSSDEETAWIPAAINTSQACASMDAVDLLDVSQEAGYRVELSWARQYSQRGGIDAVFHRIQPCSGDSRVLFRFPFDLEHPRPLASQPLKRTRNQRVATDIRREVQTRLPSYMVPQRVYVVDRMPLNASGKVDRHELSRRARLLQATTDTSSHRKPCDELEACVCEDFSTVLGVQIGVDDNFFEQGGHSLSAIRLASIASLRFDVSISVKDIFGSPTPSKLARKIGEIQRAPAEGSDNSVVTYTPFQLLGHESLYNEIYPLVKHHGSAIADVYPATAGQRFFLQNPPRDPDIYYIDFSSSVDSARLKRICIEMVERLDIFRTVFVRANDTSYAVVLERLAVPLELKDVDGDLGEATASLWASCGAKALSFGDSFLEIAILQKPESAVRLALRISHAIYDGLSFGLLLTTLRDLYSGTPLPPALTFVSYVAHSHQLRARGYKYWRSLMNDCAMTVIADPDRSNDGESTDPDAAYWAQKTIHAPQPIASDGITPATIFTAAWALTLARETDSDNVLFGRLVAARQGLPSTHRDIIGPCNNIIPVNVHLNSKEQDTESLRALLRDLRDQYLNSLPFESLGFDEIAANCTSWPGNKIQPWCYTMYQDFPPTTCEFEGDQVAWKNIPYQGPPLCELDVGGSVDANTGSLTVFMYARRRSCSTDLVDRMLVYLCDTINKLNGLGGLFDVRERELLVEQPDYRENMI
jgi:amino acid adenylation domain-containing protein